jgi:hypothetical protein
VFESPKVVQAYFESGYAALPSAPVGRGVDGIDAMA